jgi:LmbE family N-acetylglucosaminyl deacetylase
LTHGRPTLPTHIFYAPHADDETLSLGVAVAQAAEAGATVALVLLTDGSAELSALAALNGDALCAWHGLHHDPAAEGYAAGRLDAQGMGAARSAEFARAAAALGAVPQLTRVLAHRDGGLAIADARMAILAMEQEAGLPRPFHHHTMSFEFDDHPDHLAAGHALRELAAAGVVARASWYVKRSFWDRLRVDDPVETVAAPHGPVRARIRAAAEAYMDFAPALGMYAVGYHSVRPRFDALLEDFTIRRHCAPLP